MKLRVGDIVRFNIKEEHSFRYVVVAVPPSNGLTRGRVDVILFEEASLPLRKRGIGVPTEHLVKVGRVKGS